MTMIRSTLRASVLFVCVSPLLLADSLTVQGDLSTTGNVAIGAVGQPETLTVFGDATIGGTLSVGGHLVVTVDLLTPYQLSAGSGASLTSLNATQLTTGTVAAARGGAGAINGVLKANGSGVVSQAVAGTDFLAPGGSGASLTSLNASAITTGNLAWVRVDKTGSTLADLATRAFTDLTSKPTTLSGYGITDAVAKDGSGNVAVTGTLTVGGNTVATANQLSSYATTSQLSSYQLSTGSGAGLTSLNASQLTTGTVAASRGGAGAINGVLKANGSGVVSQAVAGMDYLAPTGSGASLTSLNATQLTTGTVASARGGAGTVNGMLKADGSGLVSQATAGTDYLVPTGSGASLTGLNATQLTTGTVASARGGAGTINGMLKANGSGVVSQATAGTDFLAPGGSGAGLTALNASALTTGTIPAGVLPASVTQLGSTIELGGAETTGNLAWTRVDKTGANIADLGVRLFADLQSKPTTLSGYGITDAVAKDGSGNVVVTGTLTVGGNAVATANQLSSYATTSQLSAYQLATGSGASLTSLNASQLTTGTVAAARGGAGTISGVLKANGSGVVSQAVAGTDYLAPNGNGAGLSGLTKSQVGLANVDNTSDASKPVSTAQQAAIDLRAVKTITISAGGGLTGGGDLSASRTLALDATTVASLAKADSALQPDGNASQLTGLTAAQVGALGNDNGAITTDGSGNIVTTGIITARTSIRIPPAGDLAMGEFQAGTNPATP